MSSRSSQLKIAGAMAGLALLVAFFLLSGLFRGQEKTAPEFTGTRTLQYSFTVTNNSDQVVRDAVFKTYAPVQKTSRQQIDNISTTRNYQTQADSFGNTVLEFPLTQLAPYESKVITVRASLSVSDVPQEEEIEHPERYLAAEPMVETDHPVLQALAGTFKNNHTAGNARAMAEAIYTWVANHLESEQYLADDRGALWALENRRGDCTEFMYLFVALARLQGIPARGISGYVVTGSQVLHPADFHNWAEIYIDGAWQVVDPQRRVFLQKQSDYIAMRIIQPPENSLLGRSHRYRVDGAGLVAAMN